MANTKTISALLQSYQDFDIGKLRQKLDQAKSDMRVVRPVERYSYALTRAALNVFLQHNFADMLNCLAFDIDDFEEAVAEYVPQVWPAYIADAQETLPTATIEPLSSLEFKDWHTGGAFRFGAWHRFTFPEFEVDVLWEISNELRRLGQFVGYCYLDTDKNQQFDMPPEHTGTCDRLLSVHLRTITHEILDALAISPEAAISTIKWQMEEA